ncbi:hypothetical protein BOSEA1005_30498 [Hyphomicrobiales bacterium]|nr:hypothetical protein BOSEA1005_30498 [Hyphomicrobiales bacterium]
MACSDLPNSRASGATKEADHHLAGGAFQGWLRTLAIGGHAQGGGQWSHAVPTSLPTSVAAASHRHW